LLQEGENDVNIPTPAAASESAIRCKEPIKSSIQFGSISNNNIVGNNVAMMKGTLAVTKVSEINAQLNEPSEYGITIKGNSSVIINSLGEASDSHCKEWKNADVVANKSPIQFGSLSNLVQHKDSKKDGNIVVTKMEKPVEIMPKPRTALFQGRDDDEPMARQYIQFGSFSFDVKQNKMTKEIKLDATLELACNIFVGNNLRKKYEKTRTESNLLVQIDHMNEDVT
jgi:hypothetical protein